MSSAENFTLSAKCLKKCTIHTLKYYTIFEGEQLYRKYHDRAA